MIPNTYEFPVECTCTNCGTNGIHWVDFIEWYIASHNVVASVECDNCGESYEISISEFDFEALQPEETKLPNLN